MASNKKYWKSVEELDENSSIVKTLQENEFVEEIPTDEFLGDKETLEASSTTRRDFLKYVGFTTAAASLAACEGPVIKSIPYVVAPDEIVPGVANYYATTVADGFDFANVLVKTREGRPIKIERNDLSTSGGSVNARVHASVLSLYDNNRLKAPILGGKDASWESFDTEVATSLGVMAAQNVDVVLLTQTFASPSTSRLIKEFTTKYANIRHVVYDTVSSSEALDAYQAAYGERALADYDFSKAEVIVSVGADFLGDWQGGGYEKGYAQGRIPKNGKMSKHIQFESNMTISGANADTRIPVTPSQQKQVLLALTGASATVSGLPDYVQKAVTSAKRQISNAGSKAVVITGVPDVAAQAAVLNANTGSEVMDVVNPRYMRAGNSAEVTKVMEGVINGSVKGLITVGVDPVYSFPSKDFKEAYKNLGFTLAFSMKKDATANEAKMIAATPHYLESWGDAQLKKGSYSLMQPTIRPLFKTRQFQESLLAWTGNTSSYVDYIKETWTAVLGATSWGKALHDGVLVSNVAAEVEASTFAVGPVPEATSNGAMSATLQGGGFELTLYTKTSLGDGQQANNPWLQEMPDPITRTSWDNYITMSAADAKAKDIKNWHVANGGLNGSVVNIKLANGTEIKNVPVLIQPGQAKGSLGLALGYGKTAAIQKEMQTGKNAYPLYTNFSSVQQGVSISKVEGAEHEFACIQLQNTMMGRDIIRETSLEVFNTKDVKEWNGMPQVSKDHEEIDVTSPDADLWTEFDRSVGHHFNLSIDLNACTGCGACVIACHAENNVPVVGKSEIRRSRDMHWLRIDRYYSSEENFDADKAKKEGFSGLFGDNGSLGGFGELEVAAANPQVAFQPVMCQHCNHAPCETVCPVAATSHSRQGQNHMAYNRCVGTRYCANNCPYKVRRFNWFLYNDNDEFDYNMNNDLGRMVLNPDVNVRSRGVMEKCSMCVQMTQKSILDAKREGRPVKDSEFQTACSAACESGAMVFGDVNDHDSEVYKSKEDKRMYHLLEAVGTKPNVFYKVKVTNSSEA